MHTLTNTSGSLQDQTALCTALQGCAASTLKLHERGKTISETDTFNSLCCRQQNKRRTEKTWSQKTPTCTLCICNEEPLPHSHQNTQFLSLLYPPGQLLQALFLFHLHAAIDLNCSRHVDDEVGVYAGCSLWVILIMWLIIYVITQSFPHSPTQIYKPERTHKHAETAHVSGDTRTKQRL